MDDEQKPGFFLLKHHCFSLKNHQTFGVAGCQGCLEIQVTWPAPARARPHRPDTLPGSGSQTKIHDAMVVRLSRFVGDGKPPTCNRNPYNGYINPYYWVDEFMPYLMTIPYYMEMSWELIDPGTHGFLVMGFFMLFCLVFSC